MTHNAFSNRSYQRIQRLAREGNFNAFIAETTKQYGCLGLVMPEVLKRISYCLKECPAIVSPESVEMLKGLPEEDLLMSGISGVLTDLPASPPEPKPGTICFPVVITSKGLIRSLKLYDGPGAAFSPHRLAMLDQVGSPVFKILQKQSKCHVLWRPDRYFWVILDTFGKEDLTVKGDSLGLPLALALYSHVTGIPVPSDFSATGRVMRDGSVMPVEGLRRKLQALRQERWFVKNLVVSEQQKTDDLVAGIQLVKVKTVREAVDFLFPHNILSRPVRAEINLAAEVDIINNQYENYLIDTCIENATKIIRHIGSARPRIPNDMAVPTLFTCYWRLGGCYCHKGNAREAEVNLEKSRRLFEKFPGLIRENDYWDSRINYAVLLKDVFRYSDAESLHRRIHEKMEQVGGLDHEKAKNLSSWSQLCLAQGRFEEAEAFQKKAIRMIRKEERHRNYGYLAQVHARAGHFQKAKYCLQKAEASLTALTPKRKGNSFFDWILAEHLYRYGKTLRNPERGPWKQWGQLLSRNPEITWYVPALIQKFAGLAMIHQADEAGGLQKLDEVICFFNTRLDPVLRLLGASVRVERSLYFLHRGQPKRIAEDLRGIKEDLGLQKDIKRFFKKECDQITQHLRFKKPGELAIANIEEALNSLQKQIPY